MRWPTRRAVMASGAALAALVAFGRKPATAESAILATLNNHRAAAKLGAAFAVGNDSILLTDQILAGLGIDHAQAENIARAQMRQRLARQIQADFAAGRTVRLDGWVVALTEARLCALAACKA